MVVQTTLLNSVYQDQSVSYHTDQTLRSPAAADGTACSTVQQHKFMFQSVNRHDLNRASEPASAS
jgi:hypothetical protein